MVRLADLPWYVHRVASMSPPEVAHRVREQARRRLDRRAPSGWESFEGRAGSVRALGVLSAASAGAALRKAAGAAARAARAGQFRYLGQSWPAPAAADWWDGDIWTLDPVSGEAWPGRGVFTYDVSYRHVRDRGDVKFVWELNRLQFLQPMALDAALSGDPTAFADVWSILAGWMAANPPYQGINWNSGIEAASRVISVLAVVEFAQAAGAPVDQALVSRFLAAHLRWLDRYPSLFSSANNHRVAELVAIFAACLAAPDLPRGERLAAAAQAELEREIGNIFFADGVGGEQSPTYAAYSLEWFVLAGAWGEAAGRPFSQAYRDRAASAATHLTWLLDEAGQAPRIGDDDEGRVLCLGQAPDDRYPASIAALTQRWLGEPEIASALRPIALRDLVCPRQARARAATAPSGFHAFAEGGYSIWRRPTAKGALVLTLDHAPLGFLSIAAHGHADALSVWLHWGDEAVFVDAGTYLYHSGGAWRDAFRGTPAHNTVCLAGADQSRIVGAFNWSDHAKARLVGIEGEAVIAEHDGYLKRFRLTHRRAVRWTQEGALEIEDSLVGAGAADWTSGLTLAPGVTAEVAEGQALITTPTGRRLRLIAEPAWGLSLATAAYSPAFNEKIETARLELSGRHEAGAAGPISRVVITVLD